MAPPADGFAAAAVMQAVLEMKKSTGLSDSWDSYQCEYTQSTKALVVKTADDQTSVWNKEVEGAW
jgi:hypothetical protein